MIFSKKIVKIEQNENGSHDNQMSSIGYYQPFEGWALLPEDLSTPNFPFGDIEVEEVDGVMMVTRWDALPLPESKSPIPKEVFTEELLLELAADHEERLCMLELGL